MKTELECLEVLLEEIQTMQNHMQELAEGIDQSVNKVADILQGMGIDPETLGPYTDDEDDEDDADDEDEAESSEYNSEIPWQVEEFINRNSNSLKNMMLGWCPDVDMSDHWIDMEPYDDSLIVGLLEKHAKDLGESGLFFLGKHYYSLELACRGDLEPSVDVYREKAKKWFMKAYNKHGFLAGEAAYYCARIYWREFDYVSSIKWRKRAWEVYRDKCGDAAYAATVCCYRLGDDYEALQWAKRGAMLGDGRGFRDLALDKQDYYSKRWTDKVLLNQVLESFEHDYSMIYLTAGKEKAGVMAEDCAIIYKWLDEEHRSAKWHKKALEAGNTEGKQTLVYSSLCDKPFFLYPEEVRQILENKKKGQEYNDYGYAYEQKGLIMTAVKYYRKSAEAGNEFGMCHLADCYQFGKGIHQDVDEALRWYQRAYHSNGILAGPAANRCGTIYSSIKKNERAAFGWYHMGAEEGDDMAAYHLACCYRDRKGIYYKDLFEGGLNYDIDIVDWFRRHAIEWFEKAYERKGKVAGLAAGQCGELYEKVAEEHEFPRLHGYEAIKQEAEKNGRKAVEWYRKGIELGDCGSMCGLSRFLANGIGIEKDLDEALAWSERAYDLHEDDSGLAACQCGDIYISKGDEQSAFAWFNKGAKAYNGKAIFRLAQCYEKGIGVNPDLQKAKVWYRRAVDNPSAGGAIRQKAKECLRRLESR